MTRSQQVSQEIAALLRARNPLIWVVTREEARVERCLVEAAASAGYIARTWDVAQGGVDLEGKPVRGMEGSQDPTTAFTGIRNYADRQSGTPERCVWIMRDLHAWLEGQLNAAICRALRNLTRYLPGVRREAAQALIVLTPSSKVPEELAGQVTVVEWPLPDREEIGASFDASIAALPEYEPKQDGTADTNKPLRGPAGAYRDGAIDAAVGLTGDEVMNCFTKSLVQVKRIDPALVSKDKRSIVAREKVLEWFDPLPGGLDAVGGLVNLKEWLVLRQQAYTTQAREYGLPSPKGAILVGVPGCGKSLTAKAIATAWNVPLLRLDMGALRSKFVGESEQNLRKAFAVIGAIGRCVVWLDEIEKALQGATSGSADGGVSADALGAVLSWMQDRQGEAFVVATANDAEALPPELLRKGRFDELWFVDLPNYSERVAIINVALKMARRRDDIDVGRIAGATEGFAGAEIAAIVPDAMFRAFSQVRNLTTQDLLDAADTVVPLAKTAAEKIEKLRNWAKGRARPATYSDPVAPTRPGLRAIDL